MAIGPRLRAYLALERAMVDLDDAGDLVGDDLRDRMDPIWLKLSEEERAALDRRVGNPSEFAGTVDAQALMGRDGLDAVNLRRDLIVRRIVREHFRRAA